MNLADPYVAYLKNPGASQAAALAAMLHPVHPFEARLLDLHAARGAEAITIDDGPWQGHSVTIGPRLPEAQKAGQIWFDTAELAAMILIPRDPPGDDWHPDAIRRWTPFVGWLSLRPVHAWQYRAFLELAGVRSQEIPSIQFKTYDPARILDGGDDLRPVNRLTCVEARSFAVWMGKQLPEQHFWQAARALRPDAIDLLWNGLKKEWIGYPDPDDDHARAISPQTIDSESSQERDLDEPPPAQSRTIYRYYDRSQSFGFRTAVYSEFNLVTDGSSGRPYQR